MVVAGREVPVNSDFRACLATIMAFEDKNVTNFERQAILLRNMYPGLSPDDPDEEVLVLMAAHPEEMAKQAIWFLDAGAGEGEGGGNSVGGLYSFRKDGEMIYAAFRKTYGIDLQAVDMHWWKFIALFKDLGDTEFWNLVGLRKRVKTGKASKEEKEIARNMGDAFEVEAVDTRTLEEKEAEAELVKYAKRARENRKLRQANNGGASGAAEGSQARSEDVPG